MTRNDAPTPLLTRRQAADRAGVSTSTIDRAIRRGRLPSYRLGPKPLVRFSREDVDAWIGLRR